MSLQFPPVGAAYHKNNRCIFSVWAPLKKDVTLILPGTGRKEIPMTCDREGFWTVTVDDVAPLTRYFFRIDQKDLPDPASRFQPDGVHGPSAVIDPDFSWSDSNWKGVDLGHMIIYELHVGTFTSQGTFDGIASKIGHLRDLGVNAIELMPIAQFPGNRNWGYDGVYPFAVQNSYGGPEGLKKLVDEAHRNDIAVILDVVYNHLGPEGNYFGEFAPYFTDRYKTFWGRAINFDDAHCDGARNYFLRNALMWLDEFHIDGLRLDAVHAIWDFSAKNFIEELVRNVRILENTLGRKKVLIAEFDLNNPRYIDPPSKGGYGMDGQWVDEYHHALHSLLTGETNGYYEDFGEPRHLAKSLSSSYVYTGEYSMHRKKFFGRSVRDNPYSQFVAFAQNHDQVGNRMLGDRLSSKLTPDALKLAAAAVLLSPHVPMLFMGEEYGETNPFQYFISHTEPNLINMVREGRKKEFSYFNWQGEVPDPQSEKVFSECILSWDITSDADRKMLYSFYKHLILFRKERSAMQVFERKSVLVYDPARSGVVAFERTSDDDRILIIQNFDNATAEFAVPGSFLNGRKILDSSAVEWRGPGAIAPDQIAANQQILMHPQSVLIYER